MNLYESKHKQSGGSGGGGTQVRVTGGLRSEDSAYLTLLNDCPFEHSDAGVVNFDGAIHVIGTSLNSDATLHYIFDGSNWVESVGAVYTCKYAQAIVFNDELYMLGASTNGSCVKWTGAGWTTALAQIPCGNTGFQGGRAVVYNDELYILGWDDYENKMYKWNGSGWVNFSTIPVPVNQAGVVVFNNEIHVINGYGTPNTHYKWDGTSWSFVSTPPFEPYQCTCVVFDDEIHMLGSGTEADMTKHYKWDGTSWNEVSVIPFKSKGNNAVVYHNTLYLIGSGYKYSSSYPYSKYVASYTPYGSWNFNAKVELLNLGV